MKIGDRVRYLNLVGTVTKVDIRKFIKDGEEVISTTYTAKEDNGVKFIFYGSMIGKTVKKLEDGDQLSLFNTEGRIE